MRFLSRAFSAGKSTNQKRCDAWQLTMQVIKSKVCCKKVELGSTLHNMLLQLTTLKFVA